MIGENIHIISPAVKEAIITKDENFILNLVEKQVANGVETIDLNIGPAKGQLVGAMEWLIDTIDAKYDINYSLDTTNLAELEAGFSKLKNPNIAYLNSASAEPNRLASTVELASKYGSNLIALTLNNSIGIPKTSEERLELAFEMVTVANEMGIENSKIYLDPLVLPVSVDQGQAGVTLESIRMFKESFDPEVKTVVGLSNISNGSYKEYRPLLNKVFLTLALGAGLDTAILDGCDGEIIDIFRALKGENVQIPEIYRKIYDMSQNFGEIEDIDYNKNDFEEYKVVQATRILLNKEIYTHSFIKEN